MRPTSLWLLAAIVGCGGHENDEPRAHDASLASVPLDSQAPAPTSAPPTLQAESLSAAADVQDPPPSKADAAAPPEVVPASLGPAPTLPELPLPEGEEYDQYACPIGCLAQAGAAGTLLCLSGAVNGACECAAAFIKPNDKQFKWTPILECGDHHEVTSHVPAINRQATRLGLTRATPLFEYGPFRSIPDAIERTVGDVRVGLDQTHLTLSRAGVLVDQLAWGPAERTIINDGTTIRVYALGKEFLALVSYESLIISDGQRASYRFGDHRIDDPDARWVILGRARAPDPLPLRDAEGRFPLPLHINGVPPSYSRVYPYIEGFCRGTLSLGNIEALRAVAERISEGEYAISVVANTYRALHGGELGSEVRLKNFFYDSGASTWLPPVCRPMVRSFPDAAAVPAEFARMRDQIEAQRRDMMARRPNPAIQRFR